MLPTLPENEKKQTLFSRDFILLFCMAMCNNSYMAVFYCFEQWLEGLQVSPNCMFESRFLKENEREGNNPPPK